MNYLRELKGTFLNGGTDSHRLLSSSKYSGSYQIPALFDVKVLYVKISGCSILEAPEVLRVCFPPRSIQTALELNGGRISPSEVAALTLRKDRVTTESIEVTYVSTEHLRLLGSVIFEVVDDEEVLVSGTIERSACGDGTQKSFQGFESEERTGWNLDCNSVLGSPGCAFLRGKGDIGTPPPALEICIVGDYAGSSLVLTQTIQLAKRRPARCLTTLDAIPEDEDNSNVLIMPLDQEETEIDEGGEHKQRFYVPEGMSYIENDDGEMTWFNAGVRVGVGIGLGMCLGIGIGVGLLIRTYQATTRTFRTRLF